MEQPKLEEERTQEQELLDAKSLIEKMNRLLEDSDYKHLNAALQQKLDNETLQVFGPPGGIDGELENIFKRGKVAGIYEAMNFPLLLLEGAKGTVAQLEPNPGHKEENENG